jgi:hypothetical protein
MLSTTSRASSKLILGAEPVVVQAATTRKRERRQRLVGFMVRFLL